MGRTAVNGEITGEDTNDLIGDLEVMGDLELKSEKTKKMLSQKDKATVKVQSEKIEVTREKFEELTKSLLESTIEMTRKTMGDAENEELKWALGESENTHDLTIALQKASTALQYTVAVRDKFLEAYKEIMQIQI